MSVVADRTREHAAGADLAPRRLRASDLARVASVGLRTRRMRAGLSALGIAIGVAAIVAVLGLSSSSQAGLLEEIDRLGTNLLTVTNGQSFAGKTAELPLVAPAMIARIDPVETVAETGKVEGKVYRSPLIPTVETNALEIQAASLGLLHTLGVQVVQGRYLNAATATEPVAVLGSAAAQRLGIDHIYPGERIWAANQWVYIVGILGPSVLAPGIESSVLVGFKAAERYLHFNGHPNTVYLRAQNSQVPAVQSVLAATADPEAPNEVNVSQPSATLTARADAQGAFNGLFLGLGAVALLVGAVGVANIMVISVLERRSEIGLGARSARPADRSARSSSPRRSCSGSVAARSVSHRHSRDRDLRHHQGLDDRDPHPRLGRRVRRGHADRRGRRPRPRATRRAPLTHRSAADRVRQTHPCEQRSERMGLIAPVHWRASLVHLELGLAHVGRSGSAGVDRFCAAVETSSGFWMSGRASAR